MWDWETIEFTENLENLENVEAQDDTHWLEISREELAERMHLANENIAKALKWTKPVDSTPFLTK